MKRRCVAPECKAQVDERRPACGVHWPMLPSKIQDRIWMVADGATYEAEQWFRATFGAQTKTEYTPHKWERLVRWVQQRDEARKRRREAKAKGATP